jgi:exosortase/archaeosortase
MAFLWNFLTALLFRLFGTRLPLLPFAFKESKRAYQLLTFSQSVWAGVIQYGCGMFLCMTLYEYLAWKYWNAPWSGFSMRIRMYAVMWPAMGLLIGLIRAEDNNRRRRLAAAAKTGTGPPHS